MKIEIEASIIGAIILGVFTIIAAFIARSKRKKRRRVKLTTLPITTPSLPISERQTSPDVIPTPPTPYFAHPYPLQENFTGRLAERKELTEWFTKGSSPMFAYVAIGGMGKSALTWYWLQEDIIKQGLAPEGIIWWSFYDREARFETFLEKAIKYVNKGEIDVKRIPSNRNRMDTLYTLLCNNRFLVVLDGIERVLRAYAGLGSPYQGDEVAEDKRQEFRTCIDPNVGTFFQWLASSNVKTKTLLTSRLCLKEMDGIAGCLHKELTEMNKEDAVDFFHRQGVKGTRVEIETACEPFGYHPLSLRLLSGMIVKDPKYMGDVKAWTRHNPLSELKQKEHYILELAYSSLDSRKQALVSKLSAFRNPMSYDSISIFSEYKDHEKFDKALNELEERGLLLRDIKNNRYDQHPIVRRYCYDRLTDKTGVHSQLRDYFASVPKPEKVESLDDLAPVIELYHHTVSSGLYDEAFDLLHERIDIFTFYLFGAYALEISLLRALFPDGENKQPRLKKEGDRSAALNKLAGCYHLSGQPKMAIQLDKMSKEIDERRDLLGLCIGLDNIAIGHIVLGELDPAETMLLRSINLCKEIKEEFQESLGHAELGRLLAYRGKVEQSLEELLRAVESSTKYHQDQYLGVSWAYCAIWALFTSDVEEALKSARKARELADAKHNEIDIIRAEWLLGAAFLTKGDLEEAEQHLNEALVRDRKINLVELEPDILLELVKLRFKRGHKEETLKFAKEALEIADRCEYRLKQADIHNFLTEFYLDSKELSKAKEHVKKAKERAECGYVPAMKKAEELERLIGSTD